MVYLPIEAPKRIGKSHINLFRDGIRFLLIIFKVGTLYSPLKIFLPVSLISFAMGFSYYLYTFISYGRFTNMSALIVYYGDVDFFLGLISEQITALMYKSDGDMNTPSYKKNYPTKQHENIEVSNKQ